MLHAFHHCNILIGNTIALLVLNAVSYTHLDVYKRQRNALRMAALMKIRSVFVYTHDTIGLGEDGPTHQPVEQLASLRLTPNKMCIRDRY